jgi:hypothetical protein
MCDDFKIFKLTGRSCEIQTEEGCAGPRQEHVDCECCNTRGDACCADCHWMFWPFTIIIDVVSCGPRFCYHKCKSRNVKTKPTVVYTDPMTPAKLVTVVNTEPY